MLAIKAGKNNRTPVFVDLERLLAAKGKDRIKFLKEEADRAQLSANVAKAVEAAKTVADMAAALDGIVDERGSPDKHDAAAGHADPAADRRAPPHRQPLHAAQPHRADRALCAGAGLRAARAGRDAGADPRPQGLRSGHGLGRLPGRGLPRARERLVEAWARHPEKKPVIPADEDEELHARRLVAQRCLYGVDKNPLATDLAKLSLWLATLARDHEFTFLDHALKSGDSLVGLTHGADRGGALGHVEARPAAVPATGEGPRARTLGWEFLGMWL